MKSSSGCEQDQKSGTRNAGNSLAGKHERKNHEQLLRPGHVDAGGLRDKHRGQREIERGAVEIEAVTCRDDERDDAARYSEGFHALHGARKRGFRGAGGESDGSGLSDGGYESFDWYARDQRNRQKHQEQEGKQGSVRSKDQLSKREQNG